MSEQLSSMDLQNVRHADLSPEMMELIGKQAANLFIEKGVNLNESIVKMASAHEDINQEQLKRICEFANTATYLAKHDQNKTAGAKVSYPEFELADPNRVIQDMSDGAKPTILTKVDTDYGHLPEKKQKTSSAKSDALLEELFNTKEASARADLDFSKDTAVNQVMEAKEQLVALRETLSASNEHLDLMQKGASADFYEHAKRHCLEGGSFADIVKAAQATGASNEQVQEVLRPVISLFIKEKVSSVKSMTEDMKDLTKLAHRVVDPEHQMVKAAGAIIDCNQQRGAISSGLEQIEAEIKRVNAFVKEKLSAKSTR